MSIVEDRALHCSNAHYLSDTKELRYAADRALPMINEREEHLREEGPEFDEELELIFQLKRELAELEDTAVFVCSLSAEKNQLSQWRAYCPDEGGYSIGFNTDRLAALADLQGFNLVKCLYSEEEYRPALYDLVNDTVSWYRRARRGDEFLSSFPDDPLDSFVEGFKALFVDLAAKVKHPKFSEENEWRLVSAPMAASMLPVSFRKGASTIVPYIEFAISVKEGDLREDSDYSAREVRCPISEVWVGPTPHQEPTQRSVQELLKKEFLYGRTVERSEIPYRTW